MKIHLLDYETTFMGFCHPLNKKYSFYLETKSSYYVRYISRQFYNKNYSEYYFFMDEIEKFMNGSLNKKAFDVYIDKLNFNEEWEKFRLQYIEAYKIAKKYENLL